MILLFDNTYSKRKAEIASSTYYGKVEFVKITTIAFSTCKKKEPIIKDTNRNKIENIGICSFIKYTLIFYSFSRFSGFPVFRFSRLSDELSKLQKKYFFFK